MAVVENGGAAAAADLAASAGSSITDAGSDQHHQNGGHLAGAIQMPSPGEPRHQAPFLRPHHDPAADFHMKVSRQPIPPPDVAQRPNGSGSGDGGFKQEMKDLEELLSKLNPMAAEFVPPSLAKHGSLSNGGGGGSGVYPNSFGLQNGFASNTFVNGGGTTMIGVRRKKNSYSQGKRRMNSRTSMAQREETIRKTVYVSDIDQQVTEEELATLFLTCGSVMDCRVCGDPNSVLRFAFVEFSDEESARAAINLTGTVLGFYPVRVLPSKTAIAPVDDKFLPKSEDEREMCTRTIYCTNIDKKVTQTEVKLFFEQICGMVQRLRLLGDYHHSTRIAFVEFARAESAILALNCSGMMLGTLQLRVSPSKTPVRPRAPRPPMH